MGTSFVKYGQYGFWTRDTYLSSWLKALINELQQAKPEPWFNPLAEHWAVQIKIDGGCMSPALDEFLTGNARRDSLLSISERALNNCEPAAKRTGELFTALLRGTLQTTVSSPINYLDHPE